MKTKPSSYYQITPNTIRLLGQFAANPARALLLSQVRHLGKSILRRAEEIPPAFELFIGCLERHELPSKLWLPEMEFLGFSVSPRQLSDGHYCLTYKAHGFRVRIDNDV